MSISKALSGVVRAVAMTGVAVATMFAVGSAASAATTCVDSQLPSGHFCADGHPWHN